MGSRETEAGSRGVSTQLPEGRREKKEEGGGFYLVRKVQTHASPAFLILNFVKRKSYKK